MPGMSKETADQIRDVVAEQRRQQREADEKEARRQQTRSRKKAKQDSLKHEPDEPIGTFIWKELKQFWHA